MEKLDQINKRFEDLSNGVYPFISKNRVTVLKKGFYTKDKANYRGVSMVYDAQCGYSKAILIGYYYVPKNYVIAPTGLTVTEGKKKLIRDKMDKGYEIVTHFPSLKPYTFAEGSEEYEVAKERNEMFKANK